VSSGSFRAPLHQSYQLWSFQKRKHPTYPQKVKPRFEIRNNKVKLAIEEKNIPLKKAEKILITSRTLKWN
jgi:hypothetical protein